MTGYLTDQFRLLEESVEHLYGPKNVAYGEDELVVLCLVRDGRPYVRSFLKHYRSLGARHVFFLDNGSTDGTVEALKEQEDVTVVRTHLPYKLAGAPVQDDPIGNGWTREILFKQYLFYRFGRKDRWCLCVDMDELFDYPYSDVIGLDSFLFYLKKGGHTAVAAQMIDMFPEEPLLGRATDVDAPLKELHRFCDLSNINRRNMKNSKFDGEALLSRNTTVASADLEFFGHGIRDTLFGTKPHLTKFPLVFLDGRTKPVDRSAHRVGNAVVADVTCALFHYKFVDAHLHEQVAQAVREEHRIMNSAKYKMYQRVLDESPSLQVKLQTATEVTSVNDLVDRAFLTVSDEYVSWVNAEEGRTFARRVGEGPDALVGAYLEATRRNRAKTLEVQRLDRELRKVLKRGPRQDGKSRDLASERQIGDLTRRNRALEKQLKDMQGSRGWRLLTALHRVRLAALKLFGQRG